MNFNKFYLHPCLRVAIDEFIKCHFFSSDNCKTRVNMTARFVLTNTIIFTTCNLPKQSKTEIKTITAMFVWSSFKITPERYT